jgi:hypothetical protein
MRQLMLAALVAVLMGVSAIAKADSGSCPLAVQTISGQVETSQDLGSSSEMDKINQWLANPSDEIWGAGTGLGSSYIGTWVSFQSNLLNKVIEQVGVNNYPATHATIRRACFNRSGYQSDPDCAGLDPDHAAVTPLIQLDACIIHHLGILTCLDQYGKNVDARIPDEISKLKSWLQENNSGVYNFLTTDYFSLNLGTQSWMNGITINSVIGGLSCRHTNKYNYTFEYDVKRGGVWITVPNCGEVNKCEEIKMTFNPKAEWCADITGSQSTKNYYFNYPILSPPTNFLACTGQDNCLSQATEYELTGDTFGKGTQKVPTDFVGVTEKSLISSNALMKCTNGICVSYSSGTFPLTATASASSYFGQCRGFGATVDTPEVNVPAVASNYTANIVNRAPVPTVTFNKTLININEETGVTCDIVDPDECSDKIAKVRWICADSNGVTSNCFVWKGGTGSWNTGGYTQDIIISERSNPYRATAMFKATQAGNYSVTCEATDDDANNPLSGTGIAGVQVIGGCGEDGVCNPNCNPPDPDCVHCGSDNICVQCTPADTDCVVAASSKYCALLSEEGGSESTVCGEGGDVKYKAYASGIDPVTYQWKCSSDDGIKETTQPDFTCSYSGSGTYLPSLSIVDKNKVKTACVTQTSTKVTKEGKCQLKIRRAGTGDDFSDKPIKISAQDQIEAKVNKSCISEGATKWSISGGTVSREDDNSALLKSNSPGKSAVKAEILTPDGKTIDCGEINIEIVDKLQLGT